MGGPGSGRHAGGGAGGKAAIRAANTPKQLAREMGISETRAKVLLAKKEQLRKAEVKRAQNRQKRKGF